jgi:hypothetical protein
MGVNISDMGDWDRAHPPNYSGDAIDSPNCPGTRAKRSKVLAHVWLRICDANPYNAISSAISIVVVLTAIDDCHVRFS